MEGYLTTTFPLAVTISRTCCADIIWVHLWHGPVYTCIWSYNCPVTMLDRVIRVHRLHVTTVAKSPVAQKCEVFFFATERTGQTMQHMRSISDWWVGWWAGGSSVCTGNYLQLRHKPLVACSTDAAPSLSRRGSVQKALWCWGTCRWYHFHPCSPGNVAFQFRTLLSFLEATQVMMTRSVPLNTVLTYRERTTMWEPTRRWHNGSKVHHHSRCGLPTTQLHRAGSKTSCQIAW